MKIWLINPYGPVPTEKWRDYSFSIFGKYLAEQGHEVTWWTSNFSHHFKRFRSQSYNEINISPGFNVKLIPTTGYKRNMGIGRIVRDWIFAVRMFMVGRKETAPDLILYYESMLCLGLAGPALAKYHNCALVYDQMDLWPELIVKSSPRYLRPFLELILQPVYFMRKKVFDRLDGVMALAEPYLNFVLDTSPVLKNRPQTIIYNGIDVDEFRMKMNTAQSSLDISDLVENDNFKIIFAGSLGPSYDIQNIIDVAKIVEESKMPISFLIAGDGPMKGALEDAHKNLSCMNYFGQLSQSDLCKLYNISDIGLAAYGPSSNVEMPDKFYDYTAAGLGVICSLKGEVLSQIKNHECGVYYEAGNIDSLMNGIIELTNCKEKLRKIKTNSHNCADIFSSRHQNIKLDIFLEETLKSFRKN